MAVVHVPEMKNDACAAVIGTTMTNITTLPSMSDGLKLDTMEFNFERRTVTIEYDSMKLALKNIEHHIADAGFQANECEPSAEAVAALPPECR